MAEFYPTVFGNILSSSLTTDNRLLVQGTDNETNKRRVHGIALDVYTNQVASNITKKLASNDYYYLTPDPDHISHNTITLRPKDFIVPPDGEDGLKVRFIPADSNSGNDSISTILYDDSLTSGTIDGTQNINNIIDNNNKGIVFDDDITITLNNLTIDSEKVILTINSFINTPNIVTINNVDYELSNNQVEIDTGGTSINSLTITIHKLNNVDYSTITYLSLSEGFDNPSITSDGQLPNLNNLINIGDDITSKTKTFENSLVNALIEFDNNKYYIEESNGTIFKYKSEINRISDVSQVESDNYYLGTSESQLDSGTIVKDDYNNYYTITSDSESLIENSYKYKMQKLSSIIIDECTPDPTNHTLIITEIYDVSDELSYAILDSDNNYLYVGSPRINNTPINKIELSSSGYVNYKINPINSIELTTDNDFKSRFKKPNNVTINGIKIKPGLFNYPKSVTISKKLNSNDSNEDEYEELLTAELSSNGLVYDEIEFDVKITDTIKLEFNKGLSDYSGNTTNGIDIGDIHYSVAINNNNVILTYESTSYSGNTTDGIDIEGIHYLINISENNIDLISNYPNESYLSINDSGYGIGSIELLYNDPEDSNYGVRLLLKNFNFSSESEVKNILGNRGNFMLNSTDYIPVYKNDNKDPLIINSIPDGSICRLSLVTKDELGNNLPNTEKYFILDNPIPKIKTNRLGEIIMVADYEIRENTLPCDGSLYAPEEYPELFNLIGYRYGSNGVADSNKYVGLASASGYYSEGNYSPLNTGIYTVPEGVTVTGLSITSNPIYHCSAENMIKHSSRMSSHTIYYRLSSEDTWKVYSKNVGALTAGTQIRGTCSGISYYGSETTPIIINGHLVNIIKQNFSASGTITLTVSGQLTTKGSPATMFRTPNIKKRLIIGYDGSSEGLSESKLVKAKGSSSGALPLRFLIYCR